MGRWSNPESLGMKFLAGVFADRGRYERSQKLGRFGQRFLMRGGYIEHLPGQLGGWTAMRDIYPVAPQTFREWWKTLMKTAKAEILDRIRQAARRSSPQAADRSPAANPVYLQSDPAPHDEQVEKFIERVIEYKATVRKVSAQNLPKEIEAACTLRNVRRLVVPHDLPEAWIPAGLEILRDPGLSELSSSTPATVS